MTQAYIGLGSNLADPRMQVERGLHALAALPGSRLLRQSRLYRSAPWGRLDQPEFVNAVGMLETGLEPMDLLHELLEIERGFGRARDDTRWGPRVLDMDILVYGDRVVDQAGLHVPHPRLHERAFVLAPLAEIAPGLVVPGRGRVEDLLSGVAAQRIAKLDR
jgi:2-amino-4-hydroxy-6-hydroxymethyldihydropteridine diphosphokinase